MLRIGLQDMAVIKAGFFPWLNSLPFNLWVFLPPTVRAWVRVREGACACVRVRARVSVRVQCACACVCAGTAV